MACAPAAVGGGAGSDPPADDAEDRDLPPARPGPGALSWEDLGVRLGGEGSPGGLRIDVTTLHPDAVALAGDDVRAYFDDLRRRAAPALDEEAWRDATPFLVAFSGLERDVPFDPTRLRLESEGATLHPRRIVPLGPELDRRRVGLYETAYAVYLFDPGVDLRGPLEFRYDELSSGDAWRRVVRAVERARTRSRE